MRKTLLLSVLLGAMAVAESAQKEDKEDLKILAHNHWLGQEEKPAGFVVRGAAELARALGVEAKDAKNKRFQNAAESDAAELLKVKHIDWSKQMLIVVAAGARRTGGYRVEISALRVQDGTLTVTWRLHEPAPGATVSQAVSHPARMALVERFNGRVRFDPAIEKEKK